MGALEVHAKTDTPRYYSYLAVGTISGYNPTPKWEDTVRLFQQ